jgi:hypothetical protein
VAPAPALTSLAGCAAEAFTEGWALSGCASDFTAAELDAAVSSALGCARDPAVLETSLIIGQLQGTWRMVFDRRQEMTERHVRAVMAIWREITSALDARQAVRSLRARVPDGKPSKGAALSAGLGLLLGVIDSPRYPDLLAAVQAALRDAMAEGKAGLLAVAAEQAGYPAESERRFDFKAAFGAFWQALEHLASLPRLAERWVLRIIAGCASDVGRSLARMMAAGASEAEMVAGVEAVTSGEDVRAVTALLDLAISRAMSQASLDLYRAEGLAECWFLTAGDDRVCAVPCEAAEANGPYPIDDCPVPGLHPGCRCCVTPSDPIPYRALAAYLTPAA